ncbi:MAG: Maf family protein [Dehalococcoidales bacterium]|nr:Maf family protein [Dehalococcoidales bacterium]
MKKIILASSSPRRKELLEKIGLKFEVEPGDCEEIVDTDLEPHEMVRKLSREKAEAVARKHNNGVIIAADTVVLMDGKILGKPKSPTEAKNMLRALSGKSHVVITGFTIIDESQRRILSKAVETKVSIRELNPAEIDAYVKSGEPLDKAGGYGIQGLGSVIVEKIEGDYFNVVGLPLSALAESLKEFGVDVWENWLR